MRTLAFLLLLTTSNLFGQVVDTIHVCTDKTVYVLFKTDVSLVDIGTKLDYAHQIKENIVMLKALREHVKPTSLMVKTQSDLHVWIIKYQKEPSQLLINLKEPPTAATETVTPSPLTAALKQEPINSSEEDTITTLPTPLTTITTSYQDKFLKVEQPVFVKQREQLGNRDRQAKDASMQGKLYSLLSRKQRFRDLGEISSGIYFSLHDLCVDDQHLYIKMSLFNTSSIAFELDVVYFERNQGKTMKKREAYSNMTISSTYHESVLSVQPSSEEVLVYVLDLFAYGDKDKLMVKVNERGGVRSLQFYIPAKEIVNAKFL